MGARNHPAGIKHIWPLSEREITRVRELHAEHVAACKSLDILPDHFDDFKQDWEVIPEDRRQADLWPEPVEEDLRELYTGRYPAYVTPCVGWV